MVKTPTDVSAADLMTLDTATLSSGGSACTAEGSAPDRRPSAWWIFRLGVHLAVAGIPVLAITAHVLGWVSMHTVAIWVMLPLLAVLVALVLRRAHLSDRVVLAGFLCGLVACAGYDAFRLPSIYGLHLWGDFFGSVGGWTTGSESNYLVGYLWRYVGDGGGIAVAFFVLAAMLRVAAWSRRRVLALAVGYAVCPVWTGPSSPTCLPRLDEPCFRCLPRPWP